MKKLKLHVESLAVVTFETAARTPRAGTVVAHEYTYPCTMDWCPSYYSDISCCPCTMTC